MTSTAVAGVALAGTSIGGNIVMLAGAGVLLYAFAEVATLDALLARVKAGHVVDVDGRAREAATAVALAAAVTLIAALGSIAHAPAHVVPVMLGAATIAAIGKIVTTHTAS
jgi:hypothetical protein